MEMNATKVVKEYFGRYDVIASAVSTVCVVAFTAYGGVQDMPYMAFIAINTLICSLMVFTGDFYGHLVNRFANLFILLFFVIANSQQYGSGTITTSFSIAFTSSEYVLFQASVLAILLLFNGTYLYLCRGIGGKNRYRQLRRSQYTKYTVGGGRLIVVAATATICLTAFCSFDIQILFSRNAWDTYGQILSRSGLSPIWLSVDRVIRPIPAACLLIALLSQQKRSTVVALTILSLIAVFPTGIARNLFASCWLPVILLVSERIIPGKIFVCSMLAAMLIIFPILSIFRYESPANRNIEFGTADFNSISYDASQMMMATIQTDTITGGRQLLGSMLFFVPRGVWPDKPEGSGHLIAKTNGAKFVNVSMPYFSEGYINFGWAGTAVFTLLLALGAAAADTRLSISPYASGGYWRKGAYLIIAASTFFLLRGSLMSAMAYTLAALGCFSISMALCIRKNPDTFHQ